MKISDTSLKDIRELRESIENNLSNITTLENAGQKFVETIYKKYSDSIVLLRLFVTIPMNELPDEIRQFANNLAGSANIKTPLAPESYVLTLMGTVGNNITWNRRRNSKGHIGIPLATSSFVSAIPMMSALLEQLGFELGWLRGESEIVTKNFGSLSGTFYVLDAGLTKDSKGRLIISAQDFVSANQVKTVFGLGGGYSTGDKFLTTICFLNETIDKEMAALFQSLANSFKLKTSAIIREKDSYFI